MMHEEVPTFEGQALMEISFRADSIRQQYKNLWVFAL